MAFPAGKQPLVGSEDGEDEEKTCVYAMQLVSLSVLPMTLKAAIELGLFEIIAAVKPPEGYLSAGEIAALLGTTNPHAPAMIDRILCLLASYSILAFSDSHDSEGRLIRRYGAAPVSKYFTSGEGNSSLAAFTLMNQDKVLMESWCFLKDSVLNGGIPFTLAHGIQPFEYVSKNQSFGKLLNEATKGYSSVVMSKILEKYEGFDGLKNIVDVGGGTGSNLQMIRERHPRITGINFDLPHVISKAPPFPGITHVAGDMFESIPSGEAMFIKWVLHIWSDDHCIKILKNCWKSLQNKGMLRQATATTTPKARTVGEGAINPFNIIPGPDTGRFMCEPRQPPNECPHNTQAGLGRTWAWLGDGNLNKIMVVESILPNTPEAGPEAQKAHLQDMMMLAHTIEGKERTAKEFEALALQSGFSEFKVVFNYAKFWVMEITK